MDSYFFLSVLYFLFIVKRVIVRTTPLSNEVWTNVMMLGSKGLLPPLIPDCSALRALTILKNIRNPLIFLRKMASYSCFWRVPRLKIFMQASLHQISNLLTLVSCHILVMKYIDYTGFNPKSKGSRSSKTFGNMTGISGNFIPVPYSRSLRLERWLWRMPAEIAWKLICDRL